MDDVILIAPREKKGIQLRWFILKSETHAIYQNPIQTIVQKANKYLYPVSLSV